MKRKVMCDFNKKETIKFCGASKIQALVLLNFFLGVAIINYIAHLPIK